jgi:hypothetical protein
MRPSRRILAITLVASALCADRAIAAAPALRPQVASVAGRLVSRLSVTFRRAVPSAKVYQTRREGVSGLLTQPRLKAAQPAGWLAMRLSPLLLRLPPPRA